MRILIVKLSAIGDVVAATPAAESLRRAYPEAHITWLVEKRCADAVLGNPYLDEVITLDRRGRIESLRRASGIIARLRRRRIDIAVDLQGLAKSSIMAYLSGARVRIGFARGREGSSLFYNRRIPCEVKPHSMTCHRLLIAAAGVSEDAISGKMLFPLSDDDSHEAAELLRSKGIPDGAAFAALAPATTQAYKLWLEESWSATATQLWSSFGLTPVFLGIGPDAEMIDRVRAKTNAPTVSLAGETTLKVAAAVIKRAAVAVTVDTGLMHVSVALNTPTVAVFGPTTAWRDHVGREVFRVVRKDFPCAPCRQRITCEQFDCMRAVSPEDVLRAVGEIFSSHSTIEEAPAGV